MTAAGEATAGRATRGRRRGLRPLERKLLRDLVQLRSSLGAILLVIAFGIAAFVGMRASYHDLDEARTDYESRCRMPHLWLPLERMPLGELDRVTALDGVVAARGRISFGALLDLPAASKPISGIVHSLPADGRAVIGDALLRRGAWFSGDYAPEVLVNEAFARERGIEPGDELRVILNDRKQSLRVVGTAASSEYLYVMPPGGLAPEPADYAVLWIPEPWAQATLDLDGATNEIVARMDPATASSPEATEALVRRLERRLEPFGLVRALTRREQPSARFIRDEINGLRVNSVILPGIFLLVAALVMNVMLGRLVEQQRGIIGTLKALGHGNAALVRHYAAFGLVAGGVGGLAGVLLGRLLSSGMTAMYRGFYEFPRLENPWRPSILLAGVVAAAAFGALGALGGVRRVVRLQPAEAMRPSPPVTGRRTLLERIGPLGRAVFARLGVRWRMVVRTMLRQRRRTVVGAFSCALGTGLIFTALSMFPAMRVLIDQQFVRTIRADRDLVLRDERDGGAVLEARRLPAVDRVEGQLVVAGTLSRGHLAQDGAITGLERGAVLTRLFDVRGREVAVPPRGLVLTRRLADRLGARIGDHVRFEPVRGERTVREAIVAGIADTYLGLQAWADADWLRRLVGEEDAVSVLQLDLRNDPAARRALDRELKELPALQAVNDHVDAKRRIEETFIGTMRTSVSVLVVLAGGIVFGAILTTQTVAVSERRREIATLVVNGEAPGRVAGLFLREALIVNGFGAAVGLPMGSALLVGLNEAYQTELFGFPVVLAPSVYLGTFAISVAFTLLAYLPVRRRILRLDWRAALNASE